MIFYLYCRHSSMYWNPLAQLGVESKYFDANILFNIILKIESKVCNVYDLYEAFKCDYFPWKKSGNSERRTSKRENGAKNLGELLPSSAKARLRAPTDIKGNNDKLNEVELESRCRFLMALSELVNYGYLKIDSKGVNVIRNVCVWTSRTASS